MVAKSNRRAARRWATLEKASPGISGLDEITFGGLPAGARRGVWRHRLRQDAAPPGLTPAIALSRRRREELGLLTAELGRRPIAVEPLARDPVEVGPGMQLRDHR